MLSNLQHSRYAEVLGHICLVIDAIDESSLPVDISTALFGIFKFVDQSKYKLLVPGYTFSRYLKGLPLATVNLKESLPSLPITMVLFTNLLSINSAKSYK